MHATTAPERTPHEQVAGWTPRPRNLAGARLTHALHDGYTNLLPGVLAACGWRLLPLAGRAQGTSAPLLNYQGAFSVGALLALPQTTFATGGVVMLGGVPFLRAYSIHSMFLETPPARRRRTERLCPTPWCRSAAPPKR